MREKNIQATKRLASRRNPIAFADGPVAKPDRRTHVVESAASSVGVLVPPLGIALDRPEDDAFERAIHARRDFARRPHVPERISLNGRGA